MCENSNFSFLEDDKKLQYGAKNIDKHMQGQPYGMDAKTNPYEDIIMKAVSRMENSVNYDDILNVAAYFGAEIEPLVVEMEMSSADMN